MLDIDKLHKMARIAVDRIVNDKYEPDKILIHIDDIIYETVRQHARYIIDLKKKYNIKDYK